MPDLWKQVDSYYGDLLAPAEKVFDDALLANQKAGLPAIGVSRLQGKLLEVLARVAGARRILEIGTLGGYSTLWLARALPPDGQIVTLELNPRHAEVARENLRNAGVLERIDLRVGAALDGLKALVKEAAEPFDFVFIDADKAGYPSYLEWALKLSRPGTTIVADNVVRQGSIIDARSADADVQGIRRFIEQMAAEPRLSAVVQQTVGVKGHDGFALAVVLR
jgi:predicted O-methyltransferase YrrM